jgi:hypothetical protein
MTESPIDLPTPHKYARLVCVFSKWCRLLAREYFKGASYAPNTATIFWFEDAMEANNNSHLEYFSIYSNLAPSKSLAKKQARRIRKMHLIDRLGELGLEPKAASLSNVERNTKFGHCAETLALTRYVVRISVEIFYHNWLPPYNSSMCPDHSRYFIKALAVSIKLVTRHDTYLQASEENVGSTAWSARKKVCRNCRRLLRLLQRKSGVDDRNHYDMWYAFKGTFISDAESLWAYQHFKGEHDALKDEQRGTAKRPATALKPAIDTAGDEAKKATKKVYSSPRQTVCRASSPSESESSGLTDNQHTFKGVFLLFWHLFSISYVVDWARWCRWPWSDIDFRM